MKFLKNLPIQKFLTILLAFLLLLSIFCQFFFLSNFDQAKLSVARWPQFANPHLKFALALFQTGSNKAKEELDLAKKALFQNKKLTEQTHQIINQPQEIKKQLDFWQSLSQKGLESPDVYLRLSLLYSKLYQNEEATKAWQRAFYLDPNNKLIEEVGKIVNR